MDVLFLDLRRVTPYGAADERDRDRDRDPGLVRRWIAWIARLLDLRPGDAGKPSGERAAASTRRNLLLGYTAAEILLGLGLLAWVSVAVPIGGSIASSPLDGTALAGTTGGVLLWTMFGLMGSVRSFSSSGGAGHFTFHLPFVGAAMILGGPAAGAWVGFLSTIDRRELETQPWYGVLANHTSMATAAVAGGAAYLLGQAGFLALTGDAGLASFAAVILAGLTLELVANAFAFGTIKIRDEMTWAGALGIFIDEFGAETVLEIALTWILVIAWAAVGWWSPLVIGVAVIWYASRPRSDAPNPLTSLPRKHEFVERTDRKVGWIRRGILSGGTMLYLDLNGFHLVNNQFGHDVGDVALRVIGERMREVFPRKEDLLGHLMGDEFGVFLSGLTSTEVAIRKAEQLLDAICRPIPTPVGPVNVGVAVGIVITGGPGLTPPSAQTLLERSEQAMYLAKESSGPCGAWHIWSLDEPTPFATDRLGAQR